MVPMQLFLAAMSAPVLIVAALIEELRRANDRLASVLSGISDCYYTLDRMLKSFARRGGNIACCGTCLDARGLTKDHLIDEAPRSNMEELAAWTVEADDVLTF